MVKGRIDKKDPRASVWCENKWYLFWFFSFEFISQCQFRGKFYFGINIYLLQIPISQFLKYIYLLEKVNVIIFTSDYKLSNFIRLNFYFSQCAKEIWSKEKEVEADDDDDFQRLYTVSFLQTFSTVKNYPILGIEMKIRQLFSKIVLHKWHHLELKMFIVYCPLFWWKKLLFFNATTSR